MRTLRVAGVFAMVAILLLGLLPTPATATPAIKDTWIKGPQATNLPAGVYITGYASTSLTTTADLTQVTHVVCERLQVTSATNMTLFLEVSTPGALTAFVNRVHAAGAKIVIELYCDWDAPASYNAIFDNSTLRSQLITNLAAFVNTYSMDGVDLDWEADVQSTLNKNNYSTFLIDLKTALNSLGGTKYITYAAPTNKVPFTVTASNSIDIINVMCYDVYPPTSWYGSYTQSTSYMTWWYNQGIAKSRLAMGISFAARLSDGTGWYSYRYIIETYNPATSANSANSGNYVYNGQDLVVQKTNWIKSQGYAGVMAYNLALDKYANPKSLLQGMYDVLYSPPPPTPVPPSTTTQAASSVGANGATLNSDLTDLGTASSVAMSFQWGLTTSYGGQTSSTNLTSTGSNAVALTGLQPSTTYHFRAKAVGDGTAYGSDLTFATTSGSTPTPPAPEINALAIETRAANANPSTNNTLYILRGYLNGLGTVSTVTVTFEYGLTTSYGSTVMANQNPMSAPGALTAYLSGLPPNTTYHFRAKAVGASTVYGADASFTTEAPATPTTAYQYSKDIVVTNSGPALPKAPVVTLMDLLTLVSTGLISSTGLDTRITISSTTIPHLDVSDRVLFVDDLAANSTQTYRFSGSNFPVITGMPIIVGHTGYVTIPDNPALELGNYFKVETVGYVDTTLGVDKNILIKPDGTDVAFRLYVSAAGTITVEIGHGALSASATSISSGVHTVTAQGDTGNLSIAIDGVVKQTVPLSGASVNESSDNWTLDQNDVMPYITSLAIWQGS